MRPMFTESGTSDTESDDNDRGHIGGFSPKRLRGHRDRVGLSRRRLGEMINRSASAIIGYEMKDDNPTIHAFVCLCEALALDPLELLRLSTDDAAEYEHARHERNRDPQVALVAHEFWKKVANRKAGDPDDPLAGPAT